MGETISIAELAEKVSDDVFKWFRWERVKLKNQNFNCIKQAKHAPTKKREHTHPVDVVFKYEDPYLNRTVLLNTDLKSYKKDSISAPNVRGALKSLAQTIDCARVSTEWRDLYDTSANGDVRGLLFVYNHDAEYDDNFQRYLTPPKPRDKRAEEDERALNAQSLPLEAGQQLHLIEPRTIAYMTTLIADAHQLHASGQFPATNYYFYYPELKLHRTSGLKNKRPATIEMITGPFLIVEHDPVIKYNEEKNTSEQTCPAGYVIFYNRSGGTHLEFLYLLDLLAGYQMLDSDHIIRIRVVHHAPSQSLRANFHRAINDYVVDWGFDDHKKSRLEQISLDVIPTKKTTFCPRDVGWERD